MTNSNNCSPSQTTEPTFTFQNDLDKLICNELVRILNTKQDWVICEEKIAYKLWYRGYVERTIDKNRKVKLTDKGRNLAEIISKLTNQFALQ